MTGPDVSGLDRRAVLAGVLTGLFFGLPAAVIQQVAGSGSLLAQIMLGAILFSGALAGFAAARSLPPSPFVHGAIAGALTLLGAQLVFSAWSRSFPNPIALVFWMGSFACLGAMGAWLALWSANQRSSPGGTR